MKPIEPPPGYRVRSRTTEKEFSVSDNSVIESTYVITKMERIETWGDFIAVGLVFALGVIAGWVLKGLFPSFR